MIQKLSGKSARHDGLAEKKRLTEVEYYDALKCQKPDRVLIGKAEQKRAEERTKTITC
jgi:hypothetical protein